MLRNNLLDLITTYEAAWRLSLSHLYLTSLGLRPRCPFALAVSVSDLLNDHPQQRSLAVAMARDFFQLNCLRIVWRIPACLSIFPGELLMRDRLSHLLLSSDINIMTSTQKLIQETLDKSLFSEIRNSVGLRDQARLNSLSVPHTGAWLRAIPNHNLGLTTPSQEFIVSLRYRLGIPLFPSAPSFLRCPCGSVSDTFRDHVLVCDDGPLRIRRHNA